MTRERGRRAFALAAAIVVMNLDTVLAWVLAVVFFIVAWGALGLPLWLAAVTAMVLCVGVWLAVGPLCSWRMLPWSGRIRRWGAPDTVYSPPVPVDHVAALLAPRSVGSVAPRPSKSTEPRELKPYELAGREACWRCGEPPVEGTHAWEDRGPFQLLSNHTFKCPAGHGWTNSTDGG